MATLKKRLIIDTETALYDTRKGLYGSNCLVYDLGYTVVDKYGTVYANGSFVIKEIFFNSDIMNRAYFRSKMANYITDILNSSRVMVSWSEAKEMLFKTIRDYNISEVWAYNANFDNGALLRTNKYLCNAWEFFPKGVTVKCILRLAECSITKQKMYDDFCHKHGYLTKKGTIRKTAEMVYQYITNDANFIEDHTAFEDAVIESIILNKCLRQHKKLKPSIIVNVIE